jgi:hypothetical protein
LRLAWTKIAQEYLKNKAKVSVGVVQVVEHLLTRHEAPGSDISTDKKILRDRSSVFLSKPLASLTW